MEAQRYTPTTLHHIVITPVLWSLKVTQSSPKASHNALSLVVNGDAQNRPLTVDTQKKYWLTILASSVIWKWLSIGF